ncbi:MAG: hypothetical protein EOO27_02340 [Comamonadaceae bacterium]|nr:MAG: hypothetical protein EOO27_02340 [Comamonadaceae bacterium]
MDNEESTTAVNDSAVQDTGTTESATVENNSSEVEGNESTDQVESKDESEDQGEQSSEEEINDDSDATDTQDDDQQQSKGDKRKEQLNTEIRDLVAERNQLRKEIEHANAVAYKPAGVDELIEQTNPDTGENYSRLEAQLESMRQEREVERYNSQVSESVFTLNQDINRVISDFPMFDPTNKKEFDPEVAQEVYQMLEDSLIRDPNVPEIDPSTGQPTGKGIVIGSNLKSPYKLYQSHAKAAQASARKAEIQGQRNAEKMMSNVDNTSGSQGKVTAKPFENLTPAQMREQLRAKGHDF